MGFGCRRHQGGISGTDFGGTAERSGVLQLCRYRSPAAIRIALASGAGTSPCGAGGAPFGLAVQFTPRCRSSLSLAMLGLASMFGPFWTLATSVVGGVGAAAGIAHQFGGEHRRVCGPYRIPQRQDASSRAAIGAVLACSNLLALAVRDEGPADHLRQATVVRRLCEGGSRTVCVD
jgi:hypothetical protein